MKVLDFRKIGKILFLIIISYYVLNYVLPVMAEGYINPKKIVFTFVLIFLFFEWLVYLKPLYIMWKNEILTLSEILPNSIPYLFFHPEQLIVNLIVIPLFFYFFITFVNLSIGKDMYQKEFIIEKKNGSFIHLKSKESTVDIRIYTLNKYNIGDKIKVCVIEGILGFDRINTFLINKKCPIKTIKKELSIEEISLKAEKILYKSQLN